MDGRSTASIIIIGDEILKGQTLDTNSHFLSKELYKCGIRVARISVVGDDIKAISEEVSSHSKQYTYVLTSGGIGPTHDDVTYEAIAEAFNEKLVLNKELKNILIQMCLRLNLDESATIKMSRVPETAEIHSTGLFLPIVSVKNVFLFPGIPSYLESTFHKMKQTFNQLCKPYHNTCLFVNVNEFGIADVINAAVDEFQCSVKIGSYPDIHNRYYQVKLVLEADSKEALTEAEAYLRNHLPQNSVVGEHPPNSQQAVKLMFDICNDSKFSYDQEFSVALEKSLALLETCFSMYSVQDICLSFNGGKDCTVLLHLTSLYLIKNKLLKSRKLKILYVRTTKPFPEIEDFIEQSIDRYNIQMLSYECPIKDALSSLKKDHPNIQAILMGSRLTDPYCSELQSFQKTDEDWPEFMRVNPLAHWSYAQVWKFLRELQVPYCCLYDKGYTSLGCQHNTLPNEELLATHKNGGSYYLPAYLLRDPDQERKGRSVKN